MDDYYLEPISKTGFLVGPIIFGIIGLILIIISFIPNVIKSVEWNWVVRILGFLWFLGPFITIPLFNKQINDANEIILRRNEITRKKHEKILQEENEKIIQERNYNNQERNSNIDD